MDLLAEVHRLQAENDRLQTRVSELLDYETTFHLMQEHIRDFVKIIGNDGTVHYASPSHERWLGYPMTQIVGRNGFDFIHPDDVDDTKRKLNQVFKGEHVGRLEYRYIHRDGPIVFVEARSSRILDKDGNVTGLFVVTRDITERTQAEEALKRTNDLLEEAQRIAKFGSWEWHIDDNVFRFAHWSDETYRIFGVDAGTQLSYNDWLNRMHPEDTALMNSAILRSLKSGEHSAEYRVIRPTGEERIVRSRGELVDESGRPVRFIGTIQDITEQRRMEKALRQSEAKFRLMAENILDLMGIVRIDGTIDYASPSHETLLGYAIGALTGRKFFEFVHPEDLLAVEQHFIRVVTRQSSDPFEFRYRHKDGHLIHVEALHRPVFGADGRITRVISVARDINERKRTEELLRRSEKLSVVGVLAAGMAHEIRNPLTSIYGFIQLMKSGTYDPAYYDIILAELERINFIVSEFLSMAKPQAVHFQQEDVQELLTEVVMLLRSQAILRNVVISTDFTPGIPFLYCEQNQLKQVFMNLLKNAIEAMPEGGEVVVGTRVTESAISIRIVDHGSGMSTEQIDKLGEPFFSTKHDGIGLGLVVTYKIVENHKGDIRFTSELGTGTTVEVVLPITHDTK